MGKRTNWSWAVGALALAGWAAGCGGGSETPTCAADETLCGVSCVEVGADPRHCGACDNACAANEVCAEGTCQTQCPTGQTACGGGCFTLTASVRHCGACDNACASGEACVEGACTTACAGGQTVCDGTCRDLQTDRAHCGACGTVCGDDELCVAGACALTCATGLTECSGACRDTGVDRENCGACGEVCADGEACVSGACAVVCAGFTDTLCAGACTNTDVDPQHCGACGNACAAGEVCSQGTCAGSCAPSADVCSGVCTDTDEDPANCGACGTVCTTPANTLPVCATGACAAVCLENYGDCNSDLPSTGTDGCESNFMTDLAHCGACNNACPVPANASASCAGGTCGIGACTAGFDDCDNSAANGCEVSLQSDAANCGACGTACGAGLVCDDGTCATPLCQGPGQGGVVGTTATPYASGLTSFTEYYVTPDADPNGWVYFGGLTTLYRIPKAGGANEAIHTLAGLTSSNLGYWVLVDGQNLYTLDNSFTAGSETGRLWRISTNGGTSWSLQDMANYTPLPADEFGGVAAQGGRIHVITRTFDTNGPTEIWSSNPGAATLPDPATLDVSFTGYGYCRGLAVDTLNYYTVCQRDSDNEHVVLRIDRATDAITVLSVVLANTSAAAVHADDLDGNGVADALYVRTNRRESYLVCSPAEAFAALSTHVTLTGTSTTNYGMGFDPVANALWLYDDGTHSLVRVQ